MALNQAWAISNLVKNVKTLSKAKDSSSGLQDIDIGTNLTYAIERVRSSNPNREINIIHSIPKSVLYTKANDLLVEVFENILGNAIKFDRKENVEVEIKHSITKDKKFWKLEFKDNGLGIPDEIKETIFKRLHRNEESVHGSGLGLSIVNNLTALFNGKTWVEDRVAGDYSKGSNFIVLLPKEEFK